MYIALDNYCLLWSLLLVLIVTKFVKARDVFLCETGSGLCAGRFWSLEI